MSLQDKTRQDNTGQVIKSSPRRRGRIFRLAAPALKVRSSLATHKQLVKIAHEVLGLHPSVTVTADLVDLMKTGVARWGLTWREATDITKALESAQWQRRHIA